MACGATRERRIRTPGDQRSPQRETERACAAVAQESATRHRGCGTADQPVGYRHRLFAHGAVLLGVDVDRKRARVRWRVVPRDALADPIADELQQVAREVLVPDDVLLVDE